MKAILISTLVVALVLGGLSACQAEGVGNPQARQQQPGSQTRVQPPSDSGYRDLADAENNAAATYDLALAQAEAELRQARKRCGETRGESRAACVAEAEAEFASARAAARAERDATLTVARREFRARESAG